MLRKKPVAVVQLPTTCTLTQLSVDQSMSGLNDRVLEIIDLQSPRKKKKKNPRAQLGETVGSSARVMCRLCGVDE